MCSVIVEKIIQGFYREKVLFVITESSKEVENTICKKIGRGVTYLYGEEGLILETRKRLYHKC